MLLLVHRNCVSVSTVQVCKLFLLAIVNVQIFAVDFIHSADHVQSNSFEGSSVYHWQPMMYTARDRLFVLTARLMSCLLSI